MKPTQRSQPEKACDKRAFESDITNDALTGEAASVPTRAEAANTSVVGSGTWARGPATTPTAPTAPPFRANTVIRTVQDAASHPTSSDTTVGPPAGPSAGGSPSVVSPTMIEMQGDATLVRRVGPRPSVPGTTSPAMPRNNLPARRGVLGPADPGRNVKGRRYAVITPARDEEDYAEVTLASIAAQTEPPALWIIVDDGSSDRTPAILERWQKKLPYLKVLRRDDRGTRKLGGGVIDAFSTATRPSTPTSSTTSASSTSTWNCPATTSRA